MVGVDWRQWVWDQLNGATFLVDEGGRFFVTENDERIATSGAVGAPLSDTVAMFEAGSLEAAPKARPFLVVRMQGDSPSVGTESGVEIWVYDNPGSYARIDAILAQVRVALETNVAVEGGITCEWQGDSPDLADDIYKCPTRYSSYRLVGV